MLEPPQAWITRFEGRPESRLGAEVWIAEHPMIVPCCRDGVVDPLLAATEWMVELDRASSLFDRLALVAPHCSSDPR